jgi:hypothetical protein
MYVSVDIETGGLDFNCSILQVAMIKWDSDNIEECRSIDIVIKLPTYRVEPYAANMNKDLFKAICDSDPRVVEGYTAAWNKLYNFLGFEKYNALGFNVASFDLRFLETHGFDVKRNFLHRSLEVNSLYAQKSGLGKKWVTPDFVGKKHEALYDAKVALWSAMEKLK